MSLAAWARSACGAVAFLALAGAANAQTASGKDDRLAVMVSGATLTNTNGGWGASALWLHNFSADTLLGVGGEHQSIGDARWNFGKLTLNHGFGAAQTRTNLYLDAAEGSGHDRVHDYDYSIVAVGAYQNLTRQLSIQLEDKQIDVDTSKGNLPKIAVGYVWTPRLSTTVGYTRSVSGSLDTHLAMARIDGFTKTMTLFAGLANGLASTIAIDAPLPPGAGRSLILHEYYVGMGRDFSRADTKLILDFSRLPDSNHWTLTFNTTLHKRTGAAR